MPPDPTAPDTVLTVSELAGTLRDLLGTRFPAVRVQGEISNFRNPTGHWYFTLKDAQAQLRCAMFKNRNRGVRPQPADGDAVIITGRVDFYTARGDTQLIAEHIEAAGAGALLAAFETLKRKLAAEGLFDEAAKRPIPGAPRRIGIVTSATGAALQDLLTTLRRRYPLGEAVVAPVPVQGEAAAPAIIRALASLPGREPIDVLILARGGGSLEDLWCFNDEAVARAIRACAVPVITGVGHETDFTIADFAADLRAPTPTGAAVRATPDVAEWMEDLERIEARLVDGVGRRRSASGDRLAQLAARLDRVSPGRRIEQWTQRLDEQASRLMGTRQRLLRDRRDRIVALARALRAQSPARNMRLQGARLAHLRERLQAGVPARLGVLRERLDSRSGLLRSLGPEAVLQRGYAIVTDEGGQVVRAAATLRQGDVVRSRLASGTIESEVQKVHR